MRRTRAAGLIALCVACAPNPGDLAFRRATEGAPDVAGRELERLVSEAVDDIAWQLAPSPAICLSTLGEDPSPKLLGAIKADVVTPRSECPPTYARALVFTDSSGTPNYPERPEGYVDPLGLDFIGVWVDQGEVWYFRFRYSQGAGGWYYWCPIPDEPGSHSGVACEKRGGWIA